MSESWYDRHVLPYLLDVACSMRPIRGQRSQLLPLAQGRVLEIGIGTGLNMPHYDKSRIDKVVGVDPALQMHRLAARRIRRAGLKVELVGLSAEKIPYDDASFDTVVCTYTLCTIPDPLAALGEMRRVLKPGGRLIFSEHGQAPDASVRRWQDRITPHWKKMAGGCHLNRDIAGLLRKAGFVSRDLQTDYLPGPRAFMHHYWGTATAA